MEVLANGLNSSEEDGGLYIGEEDAEKLERRPLALARVVVYRCGFAAGTAVVIGYAGKFGGEVGGALGDETLDETEPALTRAVTGLFTPLVEVVGEGNGGVDNSGVGELDTSFKFLAAIVTFERILIDCGAGLPAPLRLLTPPVVPPSSDCARRGARTDPVGNGGTFVGSAWGLDCDQVWCRVVAAALPWRLRASTAELDRRVSDEAVSERARSSGEGDLAVFPALELVTEEMLELAFTRTTGLDRVPTPTVEEGGDSVPSLRDMNLWGEEGLAG